MFFVSIYIGGDSAAKLTPKQERFVQEYMVDLNAAAAARRAGYSPKNADRIAYELLEKPHIKRAVIEATKEKTEKVQLDASWVLTRFKLISDRCVQGEPVLDKDGEPTGEWRFDAAGANKATEMIGKHLSMFTDKIQADIKAEVRQENTPDYTKLSMDELLQLRELLQKAQKETTQD